MKRPRSLGVSRGFPFWFLPLPVLRLVLAPWTFPDATATEDKKKETEGVAALPVRSTQ